MLFATPYEIDVGDVLAFKIYSERPIIAHRVIKRWELNKTYSGYRYPLGVATLVNRTEHHIYFATIGDNEFMQMPYER